MVKWSLIYHCSSIHCYLCALLATSLTMTKPIVDHKIITVKLVALEIPKYFRKTLKFIGQSQF